jgi:hypothetical protein
MCQVNYHPKDASSAAAEASGKTDRQVKVDAYIKEVWERTGKRISRADIWRRARYKSRAEFERWESYHHEKRGKKVNASAHDRFTKILVEKPHLKTFHASPRISPPCATPGVELNTACGTAKQLSQERIK